MVKCGRSAPSAASHESREIRACHRNSELGGLVDKTCDRATSRVDGLESQRRISRVGLPGTLLGFWGMEEAPDRTDAAPGDTQGEIEPGGHSRRHELIFKSGLPSHAPAFQVTLRPSKSRSGDPRRARSGSSASTARLRCANASPVASVRTSGLRRSNSSMHTCRRPTLPISTRPTLARTIRGRRPDLGAAKSQAAHRIRAVERASLKIASAYQPRRMEWASVCETGVSNVGGGIDGEAAGFPNQRAFNSFPLRQ
jgi:hypothetical protein